MKDLFKCGGGNYKQVLVYMAIETIVDYFEKNTTVQYLNPLPMPAIVTDLELSKIQWSMPGVRTSKAKELIVDKKYEELIKQSQKFSIDGDEYYGWKSNGQVMYKIIGEDDYLRVYVYTKEYE